MSVEQADETAHKLAAAIEKAIGRVTLVRTLPPERVLPKDKTIKDPS